jgi:hypothetical protein
VQICENEWRWTEDALLSSTKNTWRHSGTSLHVINGHYSKLVVLENKFVVGVFPLNLTSTRLVAHIAPRRKLRAGRVWWWPLQWVTHSNSGLNELVHTIWSLLPVSIWHPESSQPYHVAAQRKIPAGSSSLFNTLHLFSCIIQWCALGPQSLLWILRPGRVLKTFWCCTFSNHVQPWSTGTKYITSSIRDLH